MGAEWQGRVEIEGTQKAASDMEQVGRASTSAARQFKGLAATAGGLMTVFHSMRAVAGGDPSGLISLASGAALAWRAVSNLHPALRVITIAGTALIAVWPKIAGAFESSAAKAEKLKKAMLEAGLAVSGYQAAVERASRVNSALERQERAAAAAAGAWKDLTAAAAGYAATTRALGMAKVDVQEARDLERSGGDPILESAARSTAARARADVQFEAATEKTRTEQGQAQRDRDARALQSQNDVTRRDSASGVRYAAEQQLDAALYAGAPLASEQDRAMMISQARAGNRATFTAMGAAGGADVVDPAKRKAIADAYATLQTAVRDEADARAKASDSTKALAASQQVLDTKTAEAVKQAELASQVRSSAIEVADIEQRRAEAAARRDLDAAKNDAAAYDEQRKLDVLPPEQQLSMLEQRVTDAHAAVDTMSENDPAKSAALVRDLTEAKRRRDALKDSLKAKADGGGNGPATPGRPGEGIEDFVAHIGRDGVPRRMSQTRLAKQFRGKLGPSFVDKLTPSQFGAASKTADELLADLQKEANAHLATIAEKVKTLAVTE